MYLLILFTTSRGVLINGNAWRNFGKFAIVSPPPPPPHSPLTITLPRVGDVDKIIQASLEDFAIEIC